MIQSKDERKTLDELMKNNKWDVDEKPHIIVNYEKCGNCPKKPCVFLCPTSCYTLGSDGKLLFNYEGCVECGTCRVICPLEAVQWEYPKSGKGIQFKYG